ncbi:RICIN domain-containing protein [Streptococcus dentasini]
MTSYQKKQRKHQLKKTAYFNRLALAGLTTVAVGAVAMSTGAQAQADETKETISQVAATRDVNTTDAGETVEAVEAAPTSDPTGDSGQSEVVTSETSIENTQPVASQSDINSQEAVNTTTSGGVASSLQTQNGSTSQNSATASSTDYVVNEAVADTKNSDAVKRATVGKVATAAADSTYTRPVEGPISAGFEGYPGHGGIDYAVPEGTPVHAARDGVVKIAGSGHSWMGWQAGNAVLLQHADGMHTGYAHLSQIIVSVGEQVRQGQVIGYSGSTGLVTGPHLHFEILPANPDFQNGHSGRIDPTPYILNAPFKGEPTPTINSYNVEQLASEIGQSISDGDYHIVSTANPAYGLDAAGQGTANETNIQLNENATDNNQVFTVTYLGNGYYKLVHKYSNKALDVAHGDSNNGANVQLFDYHDSANQHWIIKPSRDFNSFEIVSAQNGLNLDITGINIANGTNIELFENTGSQAQQFRFIAVDKDAKRTIADGDYHIASALDENMVLDIPNYSEEDGATIQIFPNKNSENDNQVFTVKYLENGYYSIAAKNTGKVIDSDHNGAFNGTNVLMFTPNGQENQQWIIKPSNFDNFFEIVAKNKNQVLDVTGGVANPETKIELYIRNGGEGQAWKFVPVKKD